MCSHGCPGAWPFAHHMYCGTEMQCTMCSRPTCVPGRQLQSTPQPTLHPCGLACPAGRKWYWTMCSAPQLSCHMYSSGCWRTTSASKSYAVCPQDSPQHGRGGPGSGFDAQLVQGVVKVGVLLPALPAGGSSQVIRPSAAQLCGQGRWQCTRCVRRATASRLPACPMPGPHAVTASC